MPVKIKTDKEISLMKQSGSILAYVFNEVAKIIKDGISTKEIDKFVYNTIRSKNSKPSFKGYGNPPFPASSCISVNHEIIHGIPSWSTILKDGDIVGIDIGVYYNGYHSDRAVTFKVGEVSREANKLVDTTMRSFFNGIKTIKDGSYLGDISHAIQTTVEKEGFSIVREFQGHGIGSALHEKPAIPNYGKPNTGIILKKNMVLAIEPMVNLGSNKIYIEADDWTVSTKDHSLSAHYEHTVAVTETGFEILTALPDDETVKEYLNS